MEAIEELHRRVADPAHDVRPAMTAQLTAWTKQRARDIPNIIFYGPRGSGKKTLVTQLLRTIGREWGIPLTYTERDVALPGKGQTKVPTTTTKKGESVRVKQSLFTFEIDVDDMSLKDKLHLPAILEMLCGMPDIRGITKIVVLHHLHRLGEEAQLRFAHALHEYGAHTRFICTMEPAGPLEHLVSSQFIRIPVPAFTVAEISRVLTGVLPTDSTEDVIALARGNMSHVVLYAVQTLILGMAEDPIHELMVRLVDRMRGGDFKMLAVLRAYAATFMEHHIPFVTIIDEMIRAVMQHSDIPEETKTAFVDLCRGLDWTTAYRRFLWLERTLVEMFRVLQVGDGAVV